MKRALVVCRQRLGDIVGCFPAARRLAALDFAVDFCCFESYHAIFQSVSYCRPIGPAVEAERSHYDRVFELEITRGEYDRYRASQQKWRDYVYGKYAELAPANHDLPHFDRLSDVTRYGLPARYALAAPYGISQVTRVNSQWFAEQCAQLSSDPWYVLTDRAAGSASWGQPLQAHSLDHLPALIAGATIFVTINSAPNIIAAGVRTAYYQVYEPGFGGQDNYDCPAQTVLHQPPELARHSWRFWVHYWRRRLAGMDVSRDLGR